MCKAYEYYKDLINKNPDQLPLYIVYTWYNTIEEGLKFWHPIF